MCQSAACQITSVFVFCGTRLSLFHAQYRYEEHKGDDAAVANTEEPNVLAVRLLCQHDRFPQHIGTVRYDVLVLWLHAWRNAAACGITAVSAPLAYAPEAHTGMTCLELLIIGNEIY